MKILLLADLHHDFWKEDQLAPLAQVLSSVDAIILAGDVANKPKVRWKYAFKWLANYVDPAHTYVFPGNHDYYDHRLDGDDRLESIADAHNVTFAQRKSIVIDNTRFLCATLWTDLALNQSFMLNKFPIEQRMNDYRYIRMASGGFRRINAEDTAAAHQRDLAWLGKTLNTPFDGTTCVVTHHAPHPIGLNPKKSDGVHDPAYASNLSSFLKAHEGLGTYWFYGHSHGGQNANIMGWKLRSVSLGYPDENPSMNALKGYTFDTRVTPPYL